MVNTHTHTHTHIYIYIYIHMHYNEEKLIGFFNQKGEHEPSCFKSKNQIIYPGASSLAELV